MVLGLWHIPPRDVVQGVWHIHPQTTSGRVLRGKEALVIDLRSRLGEAKEDRPGDQEGRCTEWERGKEDGVQSRSKCSTQAEAGVGRATGPDSGRTVDSSCVG